MYKIIEIIKSDCPVTVMTASASLLNKNLLYKRADVMYILYIQY